MDPILERHKRNVIKSMHDEFRESLPTPQPLFDRMVDGDSSERTTEFFTAMTNSMHQLSWTCIPTWSPNVSSRHLGRVDGGGQWVLDGTVDSREIEQGSATCGQAVLSWPMIFDRSFDVAVPAGCCQFTQGFAEAQKPQPQRVGGRPR